jgi:uncharacterized protein YggU (UPF0235/DUF167 family)
MNIAMKILVKAKPGAKMAFVKRISQDELFEEKNAMPQFVVSVKEPAIGGKANHAIQRALSLYFKVPVSYVRIVSGYVSRTKVVEIGE